MTGPESPYVPTDPFIADYDYSIGAPYPREYSGWKDEILSTRVGVALHAGLNPTHTYRLRGPDATRLLGAICTNDIGRLCVGSSTHAIMCAETGNILAHGMLLRVSADDYLAYWLQAPLAYHVSTGEYDVVGEDLTGQRFLFQLSGPRALEVLEAALGESFHDVGFLQHRSATVGGATVGITGDGLSVIRVGMSGSLAYEVHGEIADAHAVYQALRAAGEPYGLRRLGALAYLPTSHTENGFPQISSHFLFAFTEDPGLLSFLTAGGWPMGDDPGRHWIAGFTPAGSLPGDATSRYCNPIELGWGHLVSLDHEFVGRAALEPLKRNPPRKIVTLEWNVDDILDTFRSQFEEGEEYRLMEFPADPISGERGRLIFSDAVYRGDRLVGKSMGRIYSAYYRRMISICPIDFDLAEPGTEVEVVWGGPEARQKRIRATVARYPLFDLPRNQDVDVADIPLPAPTAGRSA